MRRPARASCSAGRAARAGDEDAAGVELESARAAFAALGRGAGPGTRRRAARARAVWTERTPSWRSCAAWRRARRNRAIAAALVLSERTVDRHVSNLFVKLGVSSRQAAATAFAYERGLV